MHFYEADKWGGGRGRGVMPQARFWLRLCVCTCTYRYLKTDIFMICKWDWISWQETLVSCKIYCQFLFSFFWGGGGWIMNLILNQKMFAIVPVVTLINPNSPFLSWNNDLCNEWITLNNATECDIPFLPQQKDYLLIHGAVTCFWWGCHVPVRI